MKDRVVVSFDPDSIESINKAYNFCKEYKDSKEIKLEDVKAFSIFQYNSVFSAPVDVILLPVYISEGITGYTTSGVGGNFDVPFKDITYTRSHMRKRLIEAGYTKTNKRYGLIED
jgi:hypothetical protein